MGDDRTRESHSRPMIIVVHAKVGIVVQIKCDEGGWLEFVFVHSQKREGFSPQGSTGTWTESIKCQQHAYAPPGTRRCVITDYTFTETPAQGETPCPVGIKENSLITRSFSRLTRDLFHA